MAVLWSEFLALWFDRTRRRALPLLLATLLLLIPSLPARSDCSCELEGAHPHPGAAHHHEEGEAHEHHREGSGAHQSPLATSASALRSAGTGGHAHFVALAGVSSAHPGAVYCPCPRAPVSAVCAVAATPSQVNADSHALVYVRVDAPSPYRIESLIGLFGRAGPPAGSKPKLLSLSSLAGRAPPVSL